MYLYKYRCVELFSLMGMGIQKIIAYIFYNSSFIEM